MPAPLEALGELILAKLDDLTRRLDAMKVPELPGLTVVEFAKRVGLHPTTVSRRIADGTIAKKNGRIPASELRKFLS